MKLLLIFMFASLLLGLLTPRFGRREQLAVVGFSVILTVMYYRFGWRFI